MGYLQLNVMEHEKLIEKHAKALGIADAKVSWFKFNGPTAVNEALISGNIDIGSGGVPGQLMPPPQQKGEKGAGSIILSGAARGRQPARRTGGGDCG